MIKKRQLDRISIERADRESYTRLREEKQSPFYKKDLWDVFSCALAIGCANNLKKNIKIKEGLILMNTIMKNEEAMWLMRAVSLYQKQDIEVLMDHDEIIKICEEYANGGIKELYKIVFKSEAGEPIKHLETLAIEKIDDNDRNV